MAATPPPPSSPPARLHDDLITEILLRLPPGDPALLFRFSAVCKPWRRLLADPAFLRLYRKLHGAPPMLGFLFNKWSPIIARFIRTSGFGP
ncbi:hypothetical protein ACP70R_014581 [Stipagrostis hirtigluma subsp. patula]